ncbi:peptidoglycan DD-metalloendopeptidase family protein [Magnetovibrio blakemorei]|nr:peptidoglycan DD-metalloendopeptidase family protein [Magnetovibrio blakemorei]
MALITALAPANAQAKKDRVARDFRHADADDDGQLTPVEWNRRGNFERLDTNGDGQLNLQEVRALYDGHDNTDYVWPPKDMAPVSDEIDPSVRTDRVGRDALDDETFCAIGRARTCALSSATSRGLLATGTGPRFPDDAKCPGADDYWAMDYASKRDHAALHGGIDLPMPWGTPMRAVAAGSVVAIFEGKQSKRGIEIVLRHSPEQTGLPVWTYTAYGHMDALPDFKIGQRVKMGQILGPTGNSGVSAMGTAQSTTRRPAIHFVVFYAPTPAYTEAFDTIIPIDGRWMDPLAFYRQQEPFDSLAVKALPDTEKDVLVPILYTDTPPQPTTTKLVWPYACDRN